MYEQQGGTDEHDVEREVIASEHIQYHAILMSGINMVRLAIVNDYDAGVGAMLALFALLPSKVRVSFEKDRERFAKVVGSEVYAEAGRSRITRSVRAGYAVKVAECLARVVDELDSHGMLWKTRAEMVGGDL